MKSYIVVSVGWNYMLIRQDADIAKVLEVLDGAMYVEVDTKDNKTTLSQKAKAVTVTLHSKNTTSVQLLGTPLENAVAKIKEGEDVS